MPRRLNIDLHAPTFAPIVQSDSVEQTYPLRGIIVNAPGTLKVADPQGNAFTFTFTAFVAAGGAYSTFPARLDANIVKVFDTGTTIADADMIGLR